MHCPGRLIGRWTSLALVTLLSMACSDDASTGAGETFGGGTGDAGNGAGNQPGNTGGGGGSTIATGGAQDFAFFRQILEAGDIPLSTDITDEGFFAEHATPLPTTDCGELVCLRALLGVMGNLINNADCTILQLGMNTPMTPDSLPRLPLNLAVVVDISGSMEADNKIAFVREGLNTLIDSLEDEDSLSIITYEDEAEVALPVTGAQGNRFAIREVVSTLQAGGSTNFHAGLELGYREVLERWDSGRQNRVILLSDGQPTVGVTGHNDIINMSRAYNSERIGLTTIGVGRDFNERLMRELAEQGDGNVYFVDNRDAIIEVFVEEVAFFTTAIAEDLELRLNPGRAYRIRGVFGSNVWSYEGEGGVIEIPSVFLAHRRDDEDNERGRRGGGSALLIELMPRDRAQSASALSDIGQVTLSYTPLLDPETWGTERVTVQADIVYPEDAQSNAEAGFFTSEAILKNFVMLNILAGFQMASDLFHSGDAERSLGVIDNLTNRVEGINLELEDEDIEDDLRWLRLYAANLRTNGAGRPLQPIDENPWPRD